ncbi:SRPBCC family protein [Nocardia sp. CDC160]|uniref:SRPBCC family protein n=1 Tax=Nocardia sp. CDC160 TaxID=3112166 RepID=UPI002DB56B6E|nr:SRPBCC family protein [Nocardia sp. CDC160]MEC3918822.1 SRPBCC family protein [Nocardia sp. CDC160]
MVSNMHSRVIAADAEAVGRLLDTLATEDDRLWPIQQWPAMRFDRPLGVGAVGGHGPIRYTCVKYVPGHEVKFRFHRPTGFDGTHGFIVEALDARHTRLTHELIMRTRGKDRLTWPLVWRWLHDAALEDSLDRAETALVPDTTPRSQHSRYVRFLRSRIHRDQVRRHAARQMPSLAQESGAAR